MAKRATDMTDAEVAALQKRYEMTDRELYVRHELSSLLHDMESAARLKPKSRKRFDAYLGYTAAAARLRVHLLRAFDGWEERCNDNCKSLYFCERPLGHKGPHKCCKIGPRKYGLAWDNISAVSKKKKKPRKSKAGVGRRSGAP